MDFTQKNVHFQHLPKEFSLLLKKKKILTNNFLSEIENENFGWKLKLKVKVLSATFFLLFFCVLKKFTKNRFKKDVLPPFLKGY